MSTISYIYYLVDVGTNEVRYVGRTTSPDNRMYEHLRDKTSRKRAWIDWHIDRYGEPPEMVIVDSCCDNRRYLKASKMEQRYIEVAIKKGNRLLNHEVVRKMRVNRKIDINNWLDF